MKLYTSTKLPTLFSGREYFVDNDFLNFIFKNKEVFKQLYPFLSKGFPLIDPLVAFEFLKTMYIKRELKPRQQFLRHELFLPVTNNQNQFLKIQENALLLSQIYAHQKLKNDPSFIDLMLAGRVMLSGRGYLITGNRKDFPISVFDTVDLITREDEHNGSIESFCVIQFNAGKFETCCARMDSIPDS